MTPISSTIFCGAIISHNELLVMYCIPAVSLKILIIFVAGCNYKFFFFSWAGCTALAYHPQHQGASVLDN